MSTLECFQFPYGSDNYGVLVHDAQSGQTACIDAGDALATINALQTKGWALTHLLITHHHADHTAGLQEVKKATGCRVIGPIERSKAIAGIDQSVDDGDTFVFASKTVRVIHTPGHTTDMVNYHFADDKLVFTGDTLFSMGCGRLFEGDPAMMLNSVAKLLELPGDTLMYCAHEYTATNARFAQDIDPENSELDKRVKEVGQLREQNQPTVPSLLSVEKLTNPFMRVDNPGIRLALGMADASDVAVFTELRKRRDGY